MNERERIMQRSRRIGECLVWHGPLDDDGYGRTYAGGKSGQLAHRVSYETFVGPIPTGTEIDHTCRNRACVRPEHLEAVPHAVNMARRPTPPIKTKCANGHEQTTETVRERVRPNGHVHRACRLCEAEAARRYAAKKKGKTA